MSSHVQSVLIKRKKGLSIKKVVKKVLDMGFKVLKVDVTKNYYRFRQVNPNYNKYFYRTKDVNNDIMFVIGLPKKKAKKVNK